MTENSLMKRILRQKTLFLKFDSWDICDGTLPNLQETQLSTAEGTSLPKTIKLTAVSTIPKSNAEEQYDKQTAFQVKELPFLLTCAGKGAKFL